MRAISCQSSGRDGAWTLLVLPSRDDADVVVDGVSFVFAKALPEDGIAPEAVE